jgi:hypothetical protein
MHSVGDEDESLRVSIECDLDRGGVQVDSIRDDPEIGTGKRLSDSEDAEDAWVAVVQGTHGVEEVGDHGCTLRDGEAGFFVGCLGVAYRVDYSSRCEFWDQGHHGAAFGRGGDLLDFGREEDAGWGERGGEMGAVDCFEGAEGRGGDDVGYFMDSVLGGVDERTFDVGTEGFGAVF